MVVQAAQDKPVVDTLQQKKDSEAKPVNRLADAFKEVSKLANSIDARKNGGLHLEKIDDAIEKVSSAVQNYLQRIFSTTDDGTIFKEKRINVDALSDLIPVLASNPAIGKELLSRVNHDNFAHHQVADQKIDSAIDDLHGYEAARIKTAILKLVDLQAKGIKKDFPSKILRSVETILSIASDANFNQNMFSEINNIKPETIKEGAWLEPTSEELQKRKEPEQPNILDVIDTNTLVGKFQAFFHDAPPWFQFLQDHFTMGLNYLGIAFNTLAVIATNTKFFNKPVADWLDEKSEWYSRYIIPFSFAWNGLEALAGNRAVEALVRLVPAVSFWALPFYNFNTATGVSSGINYMLELVGKRFQAMNKAMPIHSMAANFKEVGQVLVDITKDFITNATTKTEDWQDKLTSLFLVGGSLGGFFFAKNDRDTWAARLFGNIRNIGGFIGDYALVTNPKFNIHKKIVGLSCGIASVLNIIMRWVAPDLARSLNHIAIAADDFGLTYWAQDSRRENKASKTQHKEPQSNNSFKNALKQLAA